MFQTLAICQKTGEPGFWEVVDTCFISICDFSSFNSFVTITSLSKLYCRFRRFILLVQRKKVISMSCNSWTSSWKPWKWVRLDLILTMRDIYTNSNLNPQTKFTSSSRSSQFKGILLWSISQIIMKTILISTRIVISYSVKQGTQLWILWKVNENWDNNMIRFPNGVKTKVEQMLMLEEINQSKRAGLGESQSGIWVGTIWVRSFEIKKW